MLKNKTETIRSLDYLRILPKSRWAWEFLRRNPAYERDYARHHQGALTRRTDETGLELLRLEKPEPDAEKWGLLFFTSPNQTALSAPVFWTEKASPQVVRVEAKVKGKDDPASLFGCLFDLKNFGDRRIHLTDAGGGEHVLIQRGGRIVQMRCGGHTLLDGDVKLRFILEGFGDLDAKFETIRRLSKLYNEHTGNALLRNDWSATMANLRDALIALDVYQAGGSHLETAMEIYGERLGRQMFAQPDRSVKNRMARARKKGVDLMKGGYLDLMRKDAK